MQLHAFVAMPFGVKPGPDGKPIDFNRVYSEYIKPALEAAGLEVFRADEETRAGDIRGDMFQELLIADLVVADLTLDNPNVWYELGVRHALRARGVVLIQSDRSYQPFDTYTDRKLRYSLKDGAPDPEKLEKERAALAKMAKDTLKSWHGRKISPVFDLLDNLAEPDWRALLLKDHNHFSDEQRRWSEKMETARRKCRAGDILLLAEETPTQALWLESIRTAAKCLMQIQQFEFALEQIDIGLEQAPTDLDLRKRKATCLGRLGHVEEAKTMALQLTEEFPDDPECWALLGRVEKADWLRCWRIEGHTPQQMRAGAMAEEPRLKESIDPYLDAFRLDPSHYYSGINALTLRYVQKHLGGKPEEAAIKTADLEGGVLWACLSALRHDPKDYWARAALAELYLLRSPVKQVEREFRSAVAVVDNDWFALDSTRQTLQLLQDIEFRPDAVTAALNVINREFTRLSSPWRPRQIIIFSGHVVDAPDRPEPRFPNNKVPAAEAKIAAALEQLQTGPEDLALTQGAAGGDLIFAKACQARQVKLKLMQPFDEPEFIERSVAPAEGDWRNRYYRVKTKLERPVLSLPEEVGASERDPFERCNLWLLYTALALGPDRVRFVCLWNGGAGDGPGGTKHMMDAVKKRTGQVVWVDTRAL